MGGGRCATARQDVGGQDARRRSGLVPGPPQRPPGRRPRDMKESILDVLLYLFEHYIAEDTVPPMGDRESLPDSPLFNELTQAGFSAAEIHKAFDWLNALAEQRPAAAEPRVGGA